jgi:hypothetical protein
MLEKPLNPKDNKHDGLLETLNVDESFKDKLKWLIFIVWLMRSLLYVANQDQRD